MSIHSPLSSPLSSPRASPLSSPLAIALSIALTTACNAPGPDEHVRRAMDALRDDHLAALAAGDLERYLRVFAADAVMMAPGTATAEGRDAIADAVRPFFASFTTREQELPSEVAVLPGGRLAYEWGRLRVELVPRDGGAPMAADGKYLFVARPGADGAWRYTHMIWNADSAVGQVGPVERPAEPERRAESNEPDDPFQGDPPSSAVRDALRQLEARLQTGEPAAVLASLAGDAVLLPPGWPPLSGRAAIEPFLRTLRDAEPPRTIGLDEVLLGGEMAVVRGRRVHLGAPQKFVMVLAPGPDGALRVRRWLWCSDRR